MDWTRIIAYITGTVDQELLLRNEYLAAENRILNEQINGRFGCRMPACRDSRAQSSGAANRLIREVPLVAANVASIQRRTTAWWNA